MFRMADGEMAAVHRALWYRRIIPETSEITIAGYLRITRPCPMRGPAGAAEIDSEGPNRSKVFLAKDFGATTG
jgi:hypothetical protein